MSSAGVADPAQAIRVSIEFAGMGLEPARGVVGILNLHWIRELGSHPQANDGNDQPAGGQGSAGQRVVGVVPAAPCTAVHAQDHWERPGAFRLVDSDLSGVLADAQILQVKLTHRVGGRGVIPVSPLCSQVLSFLITHLLGVGRNCTPIPAYKPTPNRVLGRGPTISIVPRPRPGDPNSGNTYLNLDRGLYLVQAVAQASLCRHTRTSILGRTESILLPWRPAQERD